MHSSKCPIRALFKCPIYIKFYLRDHKYKVNDKESTLIGAFV